MFDRQKQFSPKAGAQQQMAQMKKVSINSEKFSEKYTNKFTNKFQTKHSDSRPELAKTGENAPTKFNVVQNAQPDIQGLKKFYYDGGVYTKKS